MQTHKLHYFLFLSFLLHLLLFLCIWMQPLTTPLQEPEELHEELYEEQPLILTELIPTGGEQAHEIPQTTSSQSTLQTQNDEHETYSPEEHLIMDNTSDNTFLLGKNEEEDSQYDHRHEKETISHEDQSHNPEKNIFTMTQKFLQSFRHECETNTYLERKGAQRTLTGEELKFLSYQKHIDECILHAWNMVKPSRSITLHSRDVPHCASPRFAINKDGTLAFLQLASSSGNKEFDSLVLQAIKKAEPFPPIPDHLNIETYTPMGGTLRVSW